MERTALSDRLTVIAIAFMVYAGGNITHEIIGHCGSTYFLGAKCIFISTTDLRIAPELPLWKFRISAVAGSAANWLVALVCLGLLRAWRKPSPALRYFLWLSICVSLFIPSTYLLVSPIIMFGDWYNIIYELPRQFVWRSSLTAAGAVACWFSFRLCRAELGKLIGFGGRAARGVAWELIVPAYVAGGVVTVTSGLFSQLEFKWAQIQAAGGTLGLTVWLLLLPLSIPEAPTLAEHPFMIPRSIGWIVAGALVGLIFIGVLGPGIPL
jgi:hypothetical protein